MLKGLSFFYLASQFYRCNLCSNNYSIEKNQVHMQAQCLCLPILVAFDFSLSNKQIGIKGNLQNKSKPLAAGTVS